MKTVKKGITLIELIIVVMLIGALAFIAVPRLIMATVALGGSNTSAERIAAAIRHCRTLAISNALNNSPGFELDMTDVDSSGNYTRFNIFNVRTNDVNETGTIPAKVICSGDGNGKFQFGPLGSRTGGTGNLTVSGGGKTYVISVVTGTGMVKCTQQ
ncbi:MAG: prepilin-type N-terminal cleavage/methylation domain-containing protein [Sedimentisphaerales bacterium]|jgi:prepilin-type N-terminal cleavage/methylation domain-containing protein